MADNKNKQKNAYGQLSDLLQVAESDRGGHEAEHEAPLALDAEPVLYPDDSV